MEIMKGAESYSFDGNSNIGVLALQGFTGTTKTLKTYKRETEKSQPAVSYIQIKRRPCHSIGKR